MQQQATAGSKASTQEVEQQQQQSPVSPAWGGAVDLNPAGSFSFPPSECLVDSMTVFQTQLCRQHSQFQTVGHGSQ
jgi:hypothetical protein